MSRKRESTPGQRARLYLEMHRDTRMTGLPDEHRAARQDVIRGLEREDEGVRERALVGSDRHFDRPLSTGERAYQQHWQREERLDHGQVLERRRNLSGGSSPGGEHEGRRRRTAVPPRRPSPTRPIRKAADAVASTAAAVAPAPVTRGTGIALNAAAAGVGLAMLDLLLRNGKTTGNLITAITGLFNRVVSPQPLFGAAPASASSIIATAGANAVSTATAARNRTLALINAGGAATAVANARRPVTVAGSTPGLNLNQYLSQPFTTPIGGGNS